jgi:hypothetical protein
MSALFLNRKEQIADGGAPNIFLAWAGHQPGLLSFPKSLLCESYGYIGITFTATLALHACLSVPAWARTVVIHFPPTTPPPGGTLSFSVVKKMLAFPFPQFSPFALAVTSHSIQFSFGLPACGSGR